MLNSMLLFSMSPLLILPHLILPATHPELFVANQELSPEHASMTVFSAGHLPQVVLLQKIKA